MIVRELLIAALDPARSRRWLTLLTPPRLANRSPLVRRLAMGGTVALLSASLAGVATALLLLGSALRALHFLLSQVLEIEVRFSHELAGARGPARSDSLPN